MRATSSDGNAEVGIPTSKILISLWALSTVFWSIFRPPQYTYAARILLLQPAWLIRFVFGEGSWHRDLGLTLATHACYSFYVGHWHWPRLDSFDFFNEDGTLHVYFQVFPLLAVCALFAGGIVFRGKRLANHEEESAKTRRIDEQVLPSLLLPSRTTHSRLFPKKHAFSYSYLFVGIPVGIQGRINRLLSVDAQRHGWFHIDAEDYLQRGGANSTLAEKLKAYLHTQGVTDRDYAFAYLVTAPRFLGYSFNPVSFWYLYDSDTQLKYMVLEVNNTFDERRMYLLKGGQVDDDGMDDVATPPTVNGGAKAPKQIVFSDSWQKDFHVSPFNSRKGSYSLRATDPLATFEQTGHVQIDNTIVLRSSKEQPKIVARVWSESEPRDPTTITVLEATRFIAAWCWVGFATFPRIVWQAAQLSFRRNLHVWYRPEVTPTSIGRPYTDDEKYLEAFFRAFLTTAVSECTSRPLRVIYEPAHPEDNAEIVLYSPGFTYEEDNKRTLTLKVLSPAFYSRFAHYTRVKEALERECLATDEKNRTAFIDREDLITDLLEAVLELRTNIERQTLATTRADQVRWSFLRRLRCPPSSPAYFEQSDKDGRNAHRARLHGRSALDDFVRINCEDSNIYRRILTRLFLAQRLALGSPAILGAFDVVVRVALMLRAMVYCDSIDEPIDLFRWRKLSQDDVETIFGLLWWSNGIHLWRFLKG